MERSGLRSARLDRHWTLAQAAEQLEVDVNTLSRWERGKTRPHGYNIVRLCKVYEKTSAELGLENKQEMADAVEQLVVISSSVSSLHASIPDLADGQVEQVKVSEEDLSLVSSSPLASLPFIPPVLPQPRSTRSSWKRLRAVLLMVLMASIFVSGGILYAMVRSQPHGSGQRQPLSLARGQVMSTATARGTVSSTPADKVPASPGRTQLPATPASSSSASTPPARPTGIPEHTPTPARDCLYGSASHLKFTSLLGLGNTSPDTVTLTNCGGSAQNWFATVATSSGGNWLSVNPAVGTIATNGSENVQIQAAGPGLQVGTYQGSVTFHKGSAQWTVTVTFTILQV